MNNNSETITAPEISISEFLSSLTSVVRISPDEDLPNYNDAIHFSIGDNLESILVTTTPEMVDRFVDTTPAVRAPIMQEIFRRF